MADKAAEATKKTRTQAPAKKAPAAATKRAAARKISKGEAMVCEACGLSVLVDEYNGYVEETTLVCCGVPMKNRARRARGKAATKK